MTERSHFALVVPNHTVRWYAEGEHCTDPQNCDIILVDHGTVASTLVEDAEKLGTIREPELRPYTWCGHAGVIRTGLASSIGPMVSEMGFRGYERRPLETYRARRYAVVSLWAVREQRLAAAKFDDAMQGADYGWLEYPAMAVDDVFGTQLAVSESDHVVCSAHTMLVASALGFFGDRLAIRTEPMRIAMWLDVKPN